MPRYGTMVSCRTAATTAPTAASVRLIWRDPRRGAMPLDGDRTTRQPRWRLRLGKYTDRLQIRAIVLGAASCRLLGHAGPCRSPGPCRAAEPRRGGGAGASLGAG